jgi:SAM domain (Sterile alpha motif)
MQEIADWLTRLGLPEYAGSFAENGIDVSVLPHLTDQDLKDIGLCSGTAGKARCPIEPADVADVFVGRKPASLARPIGKDHA